MSLRRPVKCWRLIRPMAKSAESVDLGEPVNLPPVVADGTIYFLTDDGSLIARR